MYLFFRHNLKTRNVEIKAGKDTEDIANLQKAADFVKAFTLGFDVSHALVRLANTCLSGQYYISFNTINYQFQMLLEIIFLFFF